ncbi:MAG: hypothetical protein AB1454_09465 [Candidatus Auribacterota bacterium]
MQPLEDKNVMDISVFFGGDVKRIKLWLTCVALLVPLICCHPASAQLDSDNDGLFDEAEQLIYNTDPAKYDTDNDGLSDGEESTYISDIINIKNINTALGSAQAVCAGNDRVLVCFVDNDTVSGMFFDLNGAAISTIFPIAETSNCEKISAAFDGTHFCVVWNHGWRTHVFARLIDESGTAISDELEADHVGSSIFDMLSDPAVSSNGDNFLIAWKDWPDNSSGAFAIKTKFLNPNTNELSETKIITGGSSDYFPFEYADFVPVLASNGTNYYMVWKQIQFHIYPGGYAPPGGRIYVYGTTIDNDGQIGYCSRFYPEFVLFTPLLTSDGNNYIISLGSNNNIDPIYHNTVWTMHSNGNQMNEMQFDASGYNQNYVPFASTDGGTTLFFNETMTISNSLYTDVFLYTPTSSGITPFSLYYPINLGGTIRSQSSAGDKLVSLIKNSSAAYLVITDISSGSSPVIADTDNDGLNDYEELEVYHTTVYDNDSDDDGLIDFAELFQHSTNPNQRDMDNDGVTDGDEITKFSSDPTKADTDNDGLTDGTEVLQYIFEGFESGDFSQMNWSQDESQTYQWSIRDTGARTGSYCAGITGPLLSYLTLDIDVNADTTLAVYYKTGTTYTESHFEIVVNGASYIFPYGDDWAKATVPLPAGENTIMFNDHWNFLAALQSETKLKAQSLYLDDISIDDPANQHITDPTKADTDNDGLTDGEEDNLSSNPTSTDTDNDGLTDGFEVLQFFSNPILSDSDCDGCDDRHESVAGTDPMDSTSNFSISLIADVSSFYAQPVTLIEWKSIAGRKYTISVKSDVFGSDFVVLEDNIEAMGSTTLYYDLRNDPDPAFSGDTRLYRVTVTDSE